MSDYATLDYEESLRAPYVLIDSFNFGGESGTLKMGYDIGLVPMFHDMQSKYLQNRTMFYFLICNENDARRTFMNQTEYCFNGNYVSNDYCKVISLPTTGSPTESLYLSSSEISVNIENQEKVYFILTNCETEGSTARLRSCTTDQEGVCYKCSHNLNERSEDCLIPPRMNAMLVLNVGYTVCIDNGSCLSHEDRYMPWCAVGFLVIWIMGCCLWYWNLISERESTVELQYRMSYVPAAKIVFIIAYTTIWFFKRSGSTASAIAILNLIDQITYGIEKAMSAQIIMLIANGWKITQYSLQKRDARKVNFLSFTWGLLGVIMRDAMLVGKNKGIYALSWVAIWGAIFFNVWNSSLFNIQLLRYQMELSRISHIDPLTTPLYTKLQLFSKFRGSYGYFLIATFAISLLPVIDGIRQSDIGLELLDFVLYASLGYIFRCRKFNHLFHVTYREPNERIAPTRVHPVDGSDTSLEPWQEGMNLPKLSPTRVSKVIVIQNPDNCRVLGTTITEEPVISNDQSDNK